MTAEVLQIENAAYHDDHGRLSASMLKDFVGTFLGKQRRGGPAYYHRKYVLREPDDEVRNETIMLIGSLHGCMCDEPDQLERRYVVVPALARKSKKVFEAWLKEQPAGVRAVTDDQWRSAKRMYESVQRAFPEIQAAAGYCERTIRWTDEATGLDCKAKPDKLIVLTTGPLMIERKTTDRLSGFPYIAKALKYYLQAAHYAVGVKSWLGKIPEVRFVVAERQEPYGAACYEMPTEKLAEAMIFRTAIMKRLKWCLTAGQWPETYEECEVLDEGQ